MQEQKVTVVAGPNGSGKTRYVEQLRRQLASDSVRYIAFTDSYGVNVDGAYYLQLRWNQHDIDHETPTAGQQLERSFLLTGPDTPDRREMQQRLYQLFGLTPLLDKYVITLSSGELRKFQLTKTLFARPRLLIMDNPFIGLDAPTRQQLSDLLFQLSHEQGLQLMLVVARPDDIPPFTDEVIELCDGQAQPPCPLAAYLNRYSPPPRRVLSPEKRDAILAHPEGQHDYECQEVIRMRHVTIRYGSRTILSDLDWTVRDGDRWSLSGENGSGKSTLLSLVCADNPQSYACDITLFDRPRGTGETIWDIKRHIGYVSPEMHRSYRQNLPAIRIVASGLKDTVGLYAVPNAKEYDRCRWWLDVFGIAALADRPFLSLSSGEQRLVLLARAFVKDPQLLILDEPLHGLDPYRRQLVRDIIEAFCQRRHKTLVMVTHYPEELPDGITRSLHLPRNQ